MAITIRYQILTRWASILEMREFATQQAATHFLNHHLPKHATNIDIWIGDGISEPRQKPTWYREPTQSHGTWKYKPGEWWEANKRPHADRYEREESR